MNDERNVGRAIAAAAVVAVLVVGGIWVTGMLTPSVSVHAVAVAGWSLFVGLLLRARVRDPFLQRAAWGSFVVTLVAVLAAGAWLSRPTTVDEKVVTATKAMREPVDAMESETTAMKETKPANLLVAEGRFESLEHETRGTARVIKLANGTRKLTLTGFRTDSGPDLFVIAVPGKPRNDGDVKNYINLGALKGTSGNQQYDLPKGFRPGTHDTIYIWCRAFTVGFGRARLA